MAFESQFITVTSNSTIRVSFWIYLVDWVLALLLGLGFVFYFHRMLGFLFSVLFKIFLWRRYKVSVNIEAFKASPLGGRLFIKNLTIISADSTISILNLTFTWRYWLFRLNRLSNFYYETDYEAPELSQKQNAKLPTRFLLAIDGLEVFMYNRTFAYDNIIDILEKGNEASSADEKTDQESSSFSEEIKSGHLRFRNKKASPNSSSSSDQSMAKETPAEKGSNSLMFLLQVLPIGVRIKRGAVVVGNSTTPSILVASYKAASGTLDVARSPNAADPYRLLYDLAFDNFQLWMRPNMNYEKYRYGIEAHKEEALLAHEDINQIAQMKKYKSWFQFQKAAKKLQGLYFRILRKEPPDKEEAEQDINWRGLRRYIGDTQDDSDMFVLLSSDDQYAKYSLILDSVTTRIIYYYDCPGMQPQEVSTRTLLPPEHGVEIEVSMGTIHYGPWTDRQRVPIQNMLFPPIARDSEPTRGFLRPGSKRDFSGFRVTMIVKDEVIIRVPTREPSKDKELLKSTNTVEHSKSSRPFGWLEIKAGEGSNIGMFTSYIADENGFPNIMKVILNEPEIRSSVNHDVLFIADSHELHAKIGMPLAWNGKCVWDFDQVSLNPRLFFLREHTMLFSDLFTDFGLGDPQPYEYFRPFVYNIGWKFLNYKLFLNVNDANIVDNPLDFDNNKYLSLQGEELNCDIHLPINGVFTKSSTILFNISTPHFDLILDTPPWHTVNAFLKESNVVGRSNHFVVDGEYTFFGGVEVNTSDYVEIRCLGDEVSLKFYGFVIRYLFTLRDNYFGDHIHFRTFEEYTSEINADAASEDNQSTNEPNYWKMIKTENDMDIIITFQVRSGLVLLPYHTYSCQSHIGLNFDMLDVDMRFFNYYMDMQVDFSPISAVFVEEYYSTEDPLLSVNDYAKLYFSRKADMCVDGFSVHSHRMFGAPPDELTFYCKWDFCCGDWIIDSHPIFVKAIVNGIANFGVGFLDVENALGVAFPPAFDAANFSFQCPNFTFQLRPDAKSCVEIHLGDFLLSYNDMTNRRYSSKLVVAIPTIALKILKEDRLTACLNTSLVFTNICQKVDMLDRRQKAQEHVRNSDAPFHRVPFILLDEYRDDFYNESKGCFLTPASLPHASIPLTEETYRTSKNLKFDFDAESISSDSDYVFTGKMPPTNQYEEADFTPSYEVKPDTEYDNLIVELGDVDAFCSPKSMEVIATFLQSMEDYSMNTIMDEINVRTVKLLKSLINSTKEVKNCRIVNHEVKVKFGDFDVADTKELMQAIKKENTITLQIFDLSVALSEKVHKSVVNGTINSDEELSLALHVKDLIVSASQPFEFNAAALFNVQEIEYWMEQKADSLTGSANIESVNVSFEDLQMEWLVGYLCNMADTIEDFNAGRDVITRRINASACLVHALTLASVDYYIDHDPDVLTRPAYILRAKKEHIRFFDSWKVMARLRHIINNISPDWRREADALLKSKKYHLPDDALDEVWAVFSQWRAWEANPQERRAMFNRIFSKKVVDKDIEKLQLQFILNKIEVKLVAESATDYISLQRFSTTVTSRSKDDESYGIKNIDVIIGLGEHDSSVSTLLLDKIKIVEALKAKHEMGKAKSEHHVYHSVNVSLAVNVESLRQQFLLPSLVFQLQAGNLTTISTFKEEMRRVSNSLIMETLDFNIWGSSQHIFSHSMEGTSWVIAKTRAFEQDFYKVDFGLQKIGVHLLDKDSQFPKVVETVLNNDVPYIKETFHITDSKEKDTSTKPTVDFVGSVYVNVVVQECNWSVEVLNPFVLEGTCIGCDFNVTKLGEGYKVDTKQLKGKCSVDVDHRNILEVETSDFVNTVDVDTWGDLVLISLESCLGYAKAFSPSLVSTVSLLAANLPKLEKKIDALKSLVADTEKAAEVKEEIESTKEEVKKSKEIAFKLNFANDYVGLSTFINKAKVSFEIESTSSMVNNVAEVTTKDNELLQSIVPVYGELSIPAARLSILEKSIPIGLSNLVDLNFAVRLLSVEKLDERQTLQFESQYCRICLSEPMLFKLLKIADEVSKVISKTAAAAEPKPPVPEKKIEEDSASKISDLIFAKIATFQCLAYNFCLGWLFTDKSKEYPGIIVGAERFFAATEPNLGKFTLMEAYLSVANGNRTSNFYSTLSEKSNLNRAYLPNLQFIYMVDHGPNGKHLRMSMHGDELDVKFLSTSVVVVDKLVKLASKVQSYLERRAKPIYQELDKEPVKPGEKTPLFKNSFDSIEYVSTYAGSNVLIYRLLDDDLEHPPSLFLHSPAVKMAFKFTNNKKKMQKNSLMGEILATSSDNTLYPQCVPVIADLMSGMKGLMRKSKKSNDEVVVVEEPTKNNDFIRTLLNETNIHFGVRIEKQGLSLSCEPTAKVAAVVGLDGIFIQVNTAKSQIPAISISLLMDSVSVLLQHIYSRDISASAAIADILLTSTIEFGEVATLFSSGSISDADAYVNVKQYQDVDLFKDIWFPKEYSDLYSSFVNEPSEEDALDEDIESMLHASLDHLALAQNKNISSRFKEVSDTYAFPWVVTFVVSNIGVRVDFGQSLGNFKLVIGNFWAVSKKSMEWSQDLKTGINEITLSSVGRLGGNLTIKNVNLHTAISWKLDLGVTLDVPLILVSGGLEKFQLKMSFDHHVIAIGNFEEFSMDIYNKKSEISIAKDHLFVTTKFKLAEIYITSLTASNFVDIHNTISRMVQDNKRSYRETLRDSSKGKSVDHNMKRKTFSENAILETVKKLETRIHASAGKVLIHVYPSSISDDKVLVVKLDESRVKFQQNEYSSGISNELDLKFNDLRVSLSSITPLLESFIVEAPVTELTEQARKASGGTIFVFPSFRISMRTFQKYNSNLIEYMFQSTFNGTVDIRWNLGSINFIREMYSIHTKALESRMEYRRKMQPFDEGTDVLSKSILEQQLNAEDTTQEIDDAIKETIEKVEKSSKYRYVALAPPIIEAPQLKELGNATPPLEWFGLHRTKLPHVTHQFVIVSLQKLIHEIELEYSKMLGKA
ncbi:Protein CSF1 [Candida viswanathii]|uniref:Protein CSF1 n=1 Tax=Candida viswanathii TaxID=5486 RepID=A0A367YJ50_9ASCO|nr:Protein CSF1 [Candida viswanathii]